MRSNSSALPVSSSNGVVLRREVSAVTSSTRSDMAWNSGEWMRMSSSDIPRSSHATGWR
jgi:hypothetical protein